MTGANNITADTFSRTSNAQRENSNAIFTSENLDQLDKLVKKLLASVLPLQ